MVGFELLTTILTLLLYYNYKLQLITTKYQEARDKLLKDDIQSDQ